MYLNLKMDDKKFLFSKISLSLFHEERMRYGTAQVEKPGFLGHCTRLPLFLQK